jgi:hypothetical protein
MLRERTILYRNARGQLTTSKLAHGDFFISDPKFHKEGDIVYVNYNPEDQFASIVEEDLTSHPLTDRELATILVALRVYQQYGVRNSLQSDALNDIASNCGKFEKMDDVEIDDLCDRLNS